MVRSAWWKILIIPARRLSDIFRPENFRDSGGVDGGRRREDFSKGGAIAVASGVGDYGA